ncbi:APC family permease [Corynebacterium sp.]|uniref:APC family permease n=1 Tax=Corynebacterium sp. TaxID=1720 RepID=UPI0026476EA0|nr:APC family permease [Corynebacterium sp.]MDN5720853.1 APC family permease [Corynebacterium sp.]MDN6258456.1 APC family permease [Corynebacterium sp.]MDN6509412.1 APC family permease [Corynebacterium sp.]
MTETATVAPPQATTDPPHLTRTLGTSSLVLFGLVYMVPLTIFTTYGIVTQITGGRLPLAYLVTLVAMMFTARSYGLLSRAFPVAGSAYVYSRRTFGGPVGFLTGWALMMDYLFLPMINYLVLGIYAHEAIPAVPAWGFALAGIVLVTTLNLFGIVTIARTTYLIVALQAVFIVVFVVSSVFSLNGSGSVDLLAPLRGDGSEPGLDPLIAGAAILCLSFLGFDAVSTFSEDAKNPQRTVPRAIMLTTLIAGALFTALAYVSHLVLPQSTFADVDAAAVEVMSAAGGAFLGAFFTAAYVAGSLGSALTSQAAVSRIIYSMGRDGVLPKAVFGRLSARYKSPFAAIILTSLIGVLALVLDLDTVSSLISFGALTAFTLVNLAVIRHFFFTEKKRGARGVVNHLIVPALGFLITLWLWTSLSGLALAVGIAWVAIGVLWLAVITHGFRRPTPDLEGMD